MQRPGIEGRSPDRDVPRCGVSHAGSALPDMEDEGRDKGGPGPWSPPPLGATPAPRSPPSGLCPRLSVTSKIDKECRRLGQAGSGQTGGSRAQSHHRIRRCRTRSDRLGRAGRARARSRRPLRRPQGHHRRHQPDRDAARHRPRRRHRRKGRQRPHPRTGRRRHHLRRARQRHGQRRRRQRPHLRRDRQRRHQRRYRERHRRRGRRQRPGERR